jgi:chromosome segregation ATPase
MSKNNGRSAMTAITVEEYEEYQKLKETTLTGLELAKIQITINSLTSENSHLKKVNGSLEVEVDQLKQEIEQHNDRVLVRYLTRTCKEKHEKIKQLKEALTKCDPWGINAEKDCPKCNQSIGELYCLFCENTLDEGHLENCLYIKLIGGEGE